MRARLAVFVAATIVFSPGAGFGEGSPKQQPSDIAVRMLAPTFDELQVAAYQAAVLAKRAHEQDPHHYRALLALAAVIGGFCFATSRLTGLLGDRIRRRLRRVVTSHRDRGPPHLQLA